MRMSLDAIAVSDELQSRAAINEHVVCEYAETMQGGVTFRPIVVFFDGTTHWLADGFHRVKAARQAGLDAIDAEVKEGDSRAAKLYSTGANTDHGLRRTNADKRKSVFDMLEDDAWSRWSDREIARHCAVTHPFVAKMRRESSGNGYHLEDDAELMESLYGDDDDAPEAEVADPADPASSLPDATPAPAPFEDAMAQHNAWLAEIRGDLERMDSYDDLRRICDTLETTARRMETLGIDAAETRRMQIRAFMHMGKAIQAVIDAGFEAAREAIAATTPTATLTTISPIESQIQVWLDAIDAAVDLIHPDFKEADDFQQFIDAIEAIYRWQSEIRTLLEEAIRDLRGEIEKKRAALDDIDNAA